MKTISGKRSQRELDQLEPAAGNGLLDRRAFLRGGGAAMAAAMSGYALTAKSEPLKHDPWSLQAGSAVPAYEKRSRFEDKVARTLSNPNNEPRNSHARTPHQLFNGTVTPNGLHFVILHSGVPDIDPDKHRLVIHGLVKQPLEFTLDTLARYPMVSRMAFVECGGNSAPLFSSSRCRRTCRHCTASRRVPSGPACCLSTLARRNGHRSEGEVGCRRRRGFAGGEPQRAARQGARRRDDRALPERRAADARQRLSDAAAAARLGRQHEHQIFAAVQAYRTAGDELLRIENLLADSAGRQGVPVLFPAGSEIVHHAPVARHGHEGPGILRDFRHCLFRQRPHRAA